MTTQATLLEGKKILTEKLFYIPEDFEKIIVVGDLHGDYKSFRKALEIYHKFKSQKKTFIIFLGDYADRGKNGVEIIEELHEKIQENSSIIALKGNHEDYSPEGFPRFYPCTLINEVEMKKGNWENYFKNFLQPFFNSLPLAAIYRGELNLFFVHAGISSKIKNEEDLKNPTKEIETDLIWSDPYDGIGELPNPREAGVLFGKDITEEFCKRFNIDYIIRSHEPRKASQRPFYEHDGRVITISSTDVYGGRPHVLIIEGKKTEIFYLE